MSDFQPRLISVDKLLRVRVSAKGVSAAEQVHGEYSKYTTAEVICLDRTVIGGITEVPCGPPTIEVVDSLFVALHISICRNPVCHFSVLCCTKKLVEVLRDFTEIYLVRCLDLQTGFLPFNPFDTTADFG